MSRTPTDPPVYGTRTAPGGLSQRAMAARSLLAFQRMPKDSPERASALRAHVEQFAEPRGASCSVY